MSYGWDWWCCWRGFSFDVGYSWIVIGWGCWWWGWNVWILVVFVCVVVVCWGVVVFGLVVGFESGMVELCEDWEDGEKDYYYDKVWLVGVVV